MKVNIVIQRKKFLSDKVIIGTDNGEICILRNHTKIIGFGYYLKTENYIFNHSFAFQFINNQLQVY